MGLLRKIFGNTRKPEGFFGKLMVSGMNGGSHAALAKWGLGHISLAGSETALDCGCGGGANIARLLALLPDGHVTGLDYSEVSVAKSQSVNAAAIRAGRCAVAQGNVAALPFQDGQFDLATAFETVYFWPGIESCFAEVCRVLKKGGTFLIANESDGKNEKSLKWAEIIDGMKVYTGAELRAALSAAGFSDVTLDDDVSGDRITVISVK